MNDNEAAKYANMNHDQLLEEFPDVALIKDFSIAIRSYYIGEIDKHEFTTILTSANISNKCITEVLKIIDTIKNKDNKA